MIGPRVATGIHRHGVKAFLGADKGVPRKPRRGESGYTLLWLRRSERWRGQTHAYGIGIVAVFQQFLREEVASGGTDVGHLQAEVRWVGFGEASLGGFDEDAR